MGISLGALMCHLPLLCLLNPLSVDYGFYEIWYKNGLKMKKCIEFYGKKKIYFFFQNLIQGSAKRTFYFVLFADP